MNTTFSRFYSTKIYKPEPVDPETAQVRRISKKKLKTTRQSAHKQGRLKKLKNAVRRRVQEALRRNVSRAVAKPSIAVAPKLQKEVGSTKLPPYALQTKRARKKLKKLGLNRQRVFTNKSRPTIRRFISARVLTGETAQLGSVRRADKMQTTAD